MKRALAIGCRPFLLLCALFLLFCAAGARADEAPPLVERPIATAPRGVDAFLAAIAGNDGAKLLAVLPDAAKVELFGKPYDRARVASELRNRGAVLALLHWPGDGGKPAPAAPLKMRILSRRVGEVQVSPSGAAGPVCILHSINSAPFQLVSCAAVAPARAP
jgi:hypothetical protein